MFYNILNREMLNTLDLTLQALKVGCQDDAVLRPAEFAFHFQEGGKGYHVIQICRELIYIADTVYKYPSFFAHSDLSLVSQLAAELRNDLLALSQIDSAGFLIKCQDIVTRWSEKAVDFKPLFAKTAAASFYSNNIEGILETVKTAGSEAREQADRALANSNKSQSILGSVSETSLKAIEKIEALSREAATSVTLRTAADIFGGAKSIAMWQSVTSGVLAIASLATLYGMITQVNFFEPNVDLTSQLLMIAPHALQFTFIGALAAFFVRMFRISLNSFEQNSHRARVAASFDSFYQAVEGTEQKAQLVSTLVKTITDMPTTGLIEKGSDNMTVTNLAIDTIRKAASTKE